MVNHHYHGSLIPKAIYVNSDNNNVCFGTDQQPALTSSYYGRYFRFDGSTPSGKNMLAMLLTAKNSDRKIDVWYKESPDAGKTEANGATELTLSQVTMIGLP